VELSHWFGPCESTFYQHPRAEHHDVFRVSNDPYEGCTGRRRVRICSQHQVELRTRPCPACPGAAGVGRTGWHIDGSFQREPFSHALYHMVSVPRKVGSRGWGSRATCSQSTDAQLGATYPLARQFAHPPARPPAATGRHHVCAAARDRAEPAGGAAAAVGAAVHVQRPPQQRQAAGLLAPPHRPRHSMLPHRKVPPSRREDAHISWSPARTHPCSQSPLCACFAVHWTPVPCLSRCRHDRVVCVGPRHVTAACHRPQRDAAPTGGDRRQVHGRVQAPALHARGKAGRGAAPPCRMPP
jgi:hypothetical protein